MVTLLKKFKTVDKKILPIDIYAYTLSQGLYDM